MLLLAHSSPNLCNGPWLFPAEDEVRAGVSCRHTWEPELVSPFHHDRSWTSLVFFGCVCGGGLFCFFVLFVFAVHDLSVAILLSTHDNLLSGTMTATIVMMSAATVQKKNPDLATAFCSEALQLDATRTYGSVCYRRGCAWDVEYAPMRLSVHFCSKTGLVCTCAVETTGGTPIAHSRIPTIDNNWPG